MILIDRRYFRYCDWTSILILIIISLIGLATVFSATYRPDDPFSLFYKKQLFGICSGFLLYIFCCCTDFRSFQRWGYILYFVLIFVLCFTLIKGAVTMGGQRWITLGPIKFQPSEVAKIFFAPFASFYLAGEHNDQYTFRTFIPLLIFLVINSLLIVKQPDLGTGIIVLFSGLILLWLAGIGKKFFLALFCAACIGAPIGWQFLKPYQKQRISVFLGYGDKRKERYQIEQSQIAIGSGGAFGKGFLKGTQNKLQFLPEGRTDFIFSVFCEEWGFLGALVLLFLYALLFFRTFILIADMKNFHAQLLAAGLITPLLLSTVINLAMVLGLLPTVGIPLPLMTYGISHLWMSYISFGFVQSIAMRRFTMV